jgi:hypothetical protein
MQQSSLQSIDVQKTTSGDIDDHTIPNDPNGKLMIKIVKPQGSGNENLPIVIHFQ